MTIYISYLCMINNGLNKMENEEILLETLRSPVDDVDNVVLENITQELTQEQILLRRKQLLKIYEDRYLKIERVSKVKNSSHYIHLMFLATEPKHEIRTNWSLWYAAMLMLILPSLLLIAYNNEIGNVSFSYLLPGSILSFAGSVIMIILMFYTHKSTMIFSTYHGQAPVLKLIYNNPAQSDFLVFCHYLKLCANLARAKNTYPLSDRLAMELKEHRRLRDNKIISNDEYERAKTKIMASYESSS